MYALKNLQMLKNMKKECEDELKEISPFLADLKKNKMGKEPFKTPKFYFETLADKVIQQSNAQTSIPPQYEARPRLFDMIAGWVSSIMQPRLAIGFASLAVLIMMFFFMYEKNVPPVDTFASHEEIHQYITENIDDFDESLFLEHDNLAESDIFNSENMLKVNSDKNNISADEIEQYLKEQMDGSDVYELENDL